MADRVTGQLRVTDRVVLTGPSGSLEVIVFPLQASVGWDFIVERSVHTFRPFDGETVTLEGDLHGGMLVSARLAVSRTARDGTYRGRLVSPSGEELRIDFRLQLALRAVSADFFRQGQYYCSMRGRVVESADGWSTSSPRYIFDWQDESTVGGTVHVRPRSADVIEVECEVPEALPERYKGEISLESTFLRTLNIEVDKLDGLPWPPEYSTSEVPEAEQPARVADAESHWVSCSAMPGLKLTSTTAMGRWAQRSVNGREDPVKRIAGTIVSYTK